MSKTHEEAFIIQTKTKQSRRPKHIVKNVVLASFGRASEDPNFRLQITDHSDLSAGDEPNSLTTCDIIADVQGGLTIVPKTSTSIEGLSFL